MLVEVEGNVLIFKRGKIHKFKEPIADTVLFDDCVIVRLTADQAHHNNRNVYSFDYAGNLLWQVHERPRVTAFCPFVGIARNGGLVDLMNHDGTVMTVLPKTGQLMSESRVNFDSGSRRPRPTRNLL